ncbi:MAG: hypothetical protein R3B13_00260 [Polyangiaceae bacterium]
MTSKLGIAAATGLVFLTSSSKGSDLDAEHGTTSIQIPTTAFVVNVDNHGNVTGTASQVTVSHHESGAFCHKVAKVYVSMNTLRIQYHPTSPYERYPNLCNFDNLTFGFVFPGASNATSVSSVNAAFAGRCQTGNNSGAAFITQHPIPYTKVQVMQNYANGDSKRYLLDAPPVQLTCQPCPQLLVGNTIYLVPDQMVNSLTASWLVGGGIPPYMVKFTGSGLPTGLVVTGEVALSGRPAAGDYKTKVFVTGSCKSGTNAVFADVWFHVVAPPAPARSATPSAVPSGGGIVNLSLTVSHYEAASASAVVTPAGGAATQVALKLAPKSPPSGPWVATFTAPANGSAQPLSYAVAFRTIRRTGGTATEASTSFQVAARPAPPKLVPLH